MGLAHPPLGNPGSTTELMRFGLASFFTKVLQKSSQNIVPTFIVDEVDGTEDLFTTAVKVVFFVYVAEKWVQLPINCMRERYCRPIYACNIIIFSRISIINNILLSKV